MTGLNDADKSWLLAEPLPGESPASDKGMQDAHKGVAFSAEERLQDGRWAAGGRAGTGGGGGPWWAERGIVLKWSWQAESRERGEESFPPLPFPFGKKSLVPWESQTSRLLSEEKATWIAHGQSFVSLVFGVFWGFFVRLFRPANMDAANIWRAEQNML